MNERGFIALPIMAWGAIAAGAVILALGITAKVQTARLDNCKEASAAFQATVKAQGEVAAKEATRVNLVNLKATEAANGKTKVLLADNAALGRRLRLARSSGGILPTPAPDPGKPASNAIRFDRAQLESALQRLDAGVSDLVAEGDASRLKLSTAVEWAASVGAR